jgi:hypothetical protein
MGIESALLILLALYVVHLRIQLWLDGKVIQPFEKSTIIVPKVEKKKADMGLPALLIAALALLLALSN